MSMHALVIHVDPDEEVEDVEVCLDVPCHLHGRGCDVPEGLVCVFHALEPEGELSHP